MKPLAALIFMAILSGCSLGGLDSAITSTGDAAAKVQLSHALNTLADTREQKAKNQSAQVELQTKKLGAIASLLPSFEGTQRFNLAKQALQMNKLIELKRLDTTKSLQFYQYFLLMVLVVVLGWVLGRFFSNRKTTK